MRPPARVTLQADDARVRVSRFDFEPGAETGWHVHAHDYVITALTECRMQLEEPGGATREVTVQAGDSYRRDAGVEHNVICMGPAMSFVEVEIK